MHVQAHIAFSRRAAVAVASFAHAAAPRHPDRCGPAWTHTLTGARGNLMGMHAHDRARGGFVPLSDGTRRRQVQCRGEDPGEIVRAAARLASARRARNGQQQVRSHVGLWGFHYDM